MTSLLEFKGAFDDVGEGRPAFRGQWKLSIQPITKLHPKPQ
jgi:hypothetical protein